MIITLKHLIILLKALFYFGKEITKFQISVNFKNQTCVNHCLGIINANIGKCQVHNYNLSLFLFQQDN